MPAATTDKLKKSFNSANPTVTYVTATRAAAATELACNNLTGWPTDTAVDFVTYRLSSDGKTPVAGSQTDWVGIVSGSTITNLVRKAGAADAGNAVNDIVEAMPTATWGNDLVTAVLVHANQDGTLKTNAVTTAVITDSAVTTAKIADGAVTNAKLAVTPKASATTTLTTLTPNVDNYNIYDLTAQASALTIANPTGTANNGQVLIIRIKDDGTSRAITYGTAYVNISGLDSLTATTAGKWHIIGTMYNSAASKWHVISISTEA